MPSVTQSSRTLSEAITKKGRCSVFHQRPFDVFATTGRCRVFASGQWVIYRVFRKCGEKSETSEHKPNFGNKTTGRGCLKQGPSRQISVFSPHFRKRSTEVCGKFRNPRAHRPFHVKKPQVEALLLSGVVGISTICRILQDWALILHSRSPLIP